MYTNARNCRTGLSRQLDNIQHKRAGLLFSRSSTFSKQKDNISPHCFESTWKKVTSDIPVENNERIARENKSKSGSNTTKISL